MQLIPFARCRRRLALGTLAASATLMLGASSALAGNGRSPVQPGITPANVPGAKVFGQTPASTQETVSFVLKEQNLGTLQRKVETGFSPFLSVGQFAQQYGASTSTISALTSYLQSYNISTHVYPDNVDVVATGRAGDFNKALDISQSQYSTPATAGKDGAPGHSAQTFHGTTDTPSLPSSLADQIVAVLGLTNYAAFNSSTAHIDSSAVAAKPNSSNSCEQLTGLPSACHLPQDFASRYGLSPLYKKGAHGQGQTIAIVTLAALDPGAPQYFWQNVEGLPASGRTVSTVNVDGGPGAPSDASGSGETDLDVEQSGGLAPDANVIVYQAPNSDSGWADAFFQAASQNIASTVSSSWGSSETVLQAAINAGQESPGWLAAFDESFLEMAAQGQSGFLSSGDYGAYTAVEDLGTTNLSVGGPADSPYITAAGGTTLPWSGTLTGSTGQSATVSVPSERIWGWDYLWQPVATVTGETLEQSAESQPIGSGGGFSVLEPEPSYQQGVSGTSSFSAVQYLTPTDYQSMYGLNEPTAWSFNPTPSVSSGTGSGRAMPDVSADADPYSGYLLYEPSAAAVGQPELQGGWGGTSFVAPQLNGSTAVIDSYLGHRVGFWNPAMYAAATGPGRSPLTPLDQSGTGNDNLYYTGTPGQKFNEGAGLGTPNLAGLAGRF